ncbi:hypothetical protein BU24DRAFT_420802 [Aaosphaeria arxii CBS 175.79]|uniref:ClpP/crotonase n=1 Tax=Aaosphaeria arxii CBS 175.79 TaxID=1450172 RepID=A0A6A5XXT2_9PLEO|nr:uncharacterized protein BU24DRAFT_420802 [Aaosphaeria arxii CBS 175.79]KAF2017759.1 hypothetical protein BU24DRAFT_420802 [Aaosphaeria arxii CBS 175.79]
MPTIALLNGHAFGAGVFIAMAADYRVQNPSRGFFCLPEVDIGLRIPPPIATMIRRKMAHPHAYRTAALEGKRLGGKEALDLGIVDVLGGMEECVGLIEERGLVAKSEGGVYGVLKRDAYSDVLEGFEVGKEGEKAKL